MDTAQPSSGGTTRSSPRGWRSWVSGAATSPAPNDDGALRDAGAAEAEAIMVLSDDDALNLQVALDELLGAVPRVALRLLRSRRRAWTRAVSARCSFRIPVAC